MLVNINHAELLQRLRAEGVSTELILDIAEALKRRRRMPTLLPPDWAPTEDDVVALLDLGWEAPDIESEIAHFIDHARSKGRKQADWNAAFRNWMRSPYQHKGP